VLGLMSETVTPKEFHEVDLERDVRIWRFSPSG
jgi:hypothetical protein